jgi:hypothetical protein
LCLLHRLNCSCCRLSFSPLSLCLLHPSLNLRLIFSFHLSLQPPGHRFILAHPLFPSSCCQALPLPVFRNLALPVRCLVRLAHLCLQLSLQHPGRRFVPAHPLVPAERSSSIRCRSSSVREQVHDSSIEEVVVVHAVDILEPPPRKHQLVLLWRQAGQVRQAPLQLRYLRAAADLQPQPLTIRQVLDKQRDSDRWRLRDTDQATAPPNHLRRVGALGIIVNNAAQR